MYLFIIRRIVMFVLLTEKPKKKNKTHLKPSKLISPTLRIFPPLV